MTTSAPLTRRAPRLLGLARAELTLLLRNRMQLFMAVVMPVLLPLLFLTAKKQGTNATVLAVILSLMVAMALIFVVYYNLLSTYVARRQSLVLKRLRTGEASDGTVLLAAAIPALVIAMVMVGVMIALSIPVLDLPAPAQPGILALGVLLGALVMVPLALLTANITRTVESAQVTCLPFIVLGFVGVGTVLPLDFLPDPVVNGARLLPTAPMASLVHAGWLGTDLEGATLSTGELWSNAAVPVALLIAWILLASFVVSRSFRWEPRT